ncbi:MAG: DUF2490 domain-containing protein [Bacteroidota bacterium]
MKATLLILILSVTIANTATLAQTKQTEHVEQVWLGYFNQTRFSNKWGGWLDIQLRTKDDFVKDLSVSLNRIGLTYYLNDNAKITAGYAFVNFFPGDNHKDISQPEHRPWQQIQWHTKYPKIRLMQWFRLDERFRRKIANDSTLASGYSFNWKLRYNFFMGIPLSKTPFAPKTFSAVINNEVHVNFGKQIVYNYFDQNRFFLGFAYHTNAHDNIQLGFMNVFQQLAAGNKYRSTNTIRLFYLHNLDLRKK